VQADNDFNEFFSIFPANGEDGAGLNYDLEQFAAVIVELEKVADKD
jgi:hypothetical protein